METLESNIESLKKGVENPHVPVPLRSKMKAKLVELLAKKAEQDEKSQEPTVEDLKSRLTTLKKMSAKNPKNKDYKARITIVEKMIAKKKKAKGGEIKDKDILNAKKHFNKDVNVWQYVTPSGQVLITKKTEKGLDSEWEKYKKVWVYEDGGELDEEEYIEYLNEIGDIYDFDSDEWIIGGESRADEYYGRYGEALRDYDPVAFNVGYREYSSKYSKGGKIKSQYGKKSGKTVWGAWSIDQREHFFSDHWDEIEKSAKDSGEKLNKSSINDWVEESFENLPIDVQMAVDFHVKEGQYGKGGQVDKWMQEADEEMEKKGTIGVFTKKAKKHGMTTVAFAKEVLNPLNKDKYDLKTRQEAQFMKNANPKLFKDGGLIPNAYKGLTPAKVWKIWDRGQRAHFMSDHWEDISTWNNNLASRKRGRAVSLDDTNLEDWSKSPFYKVPKAVQYALRDHLKHGQYEEGGEA